MNPVRYGWNFFYPYVLAGIILCVPCGVVVGIISGNSGRVQTLRAYNDCLRAMSDKPINVIQLICDKIKDKL